MIFQNYSQTYASAITSLVGMVAAVLPFFGVHVLPAQMEFVVGVVVNFVGIFWTIAHRNSKGDVSALGFRKS